MTTNRNLVQYPDRARSGVLDFACVHCPVHLGVVAPRRNHPTIEAYAFANFSQRLLNTAKNLGRSRPGGNRQRTNQSNKSEDRFHLPALPSSVFRRRKCWTALLI